MFSAPGRIRTPDWVVPLVLVFFLLLCWASSTFQHTGVSKRLSGSFFKFLLFYLSAVSFVRHGMSLTVFMCMCVAMVLVVITPSMCCTVFLCDLRMPSRALWIADFSGFPRLLLA